MGPGTFYWLTPLSSGLDVILLLLLKYLSIQYLKSSTGDFSSGYRAKDPRKKRNLHANCHHIPKPILPSIQAINRTHTRWKRPVFDNGTGEERAGGGEGMWGSQ